MAIDYDFCFRVKGTVVQDNSDLSRVIQLVNYRAGSRGQIVSTEIILYVKERILSFSVGLILMLY